ncbi:TetR/AcrR family transcriptional regulator [Sporosarcina sp. ACRSL]|uniref:TetR/AcrR family transcriptional regulator n=1 Tax=Sporosarcina sp. ACRSL TaxID=2918215 RepID=UPI001EF51088|nr:TetR/AcrR family transcriptional regulator [Sporosarcina sp. ACRSL]MCG7344760.1 TetR/AcrR family transcriptional regulator [Sporosarcina sp. ACRSL]
MSRKMDPRVQRTKAMFEEALLDLMEEKDYKKITVREISERANLNRATFYLHYVDKDQLLEQMLDEALEKLRVCVQVKDIEFEYDSDNPHPIFVQLFTKMIESDRFYKVMLVQEKVPYFTESVREVIETLVCRSTQVMIDDKLEFVVPIEITIAYVTSAYFGVIVWWVKNDMPYTPAYMAKQMTRVSTVGPWVENPFL